MATNVDSDPASGLRQVYPHPVADVAAVEILC
ncbi:hypothetical protein FOVG_18889 [Fusarium oxysporum f. sp. pisi HDV247]|uniref:Uncharacterized protein n=2 Tax=Fusarium oxysporum TaxID=5507 RepID=W9L1T7_FUSOX|nr:hypothetical protein FOZG_04458 [Fusarium oxysporum Fo47]EXA29645.1 hypothetical protein FOVG_18889 [Fusarium oxysporum f. sp. pisi HDV247]